MVSNLVINVLCLITVLRANAEDPHCGESKAKSHYRGTDGQCKPWKVPHDRFTTGWCPWGFSWMKDGYYCALMEFEFQQSDGYRCPKFYYHHPLNHNMCKTMRADLLGSYPNVWCPNGYVLRDSHGVCLLETIPIAENRKYPCHLVDYFYYPATNDTCTSLIYEVSKKRSFKCRKNFVRHYRWCFLKEFTVHQEGYLAPKQYYRSSKNVYKYKLTNGPERSEETCGSSQVRLAGQCHSKTSSVKSGDLCDSNYVLHEGKCVLEKCSLGLCDESQGCTSGWGVLSSASLQCVVCLGPQYSEGNAYTACQSLPNCRDAVTSSTGLHDAKKCAVCNTNYVEYEGTCYPKSYRLTGEQTCNPLGYYLSDKQQCELYRYEPELGEGCDVTFVKLFDLCVKQTLPLGAWCRDERSYYLSSENECTLYRYHPAPGEECEFPGVKGNHFEGMCYMESYNFHGVHRCNAEDGYYLSSENQCTLMWYERKPGVEMCKDTYRKFDGACYDESLDFYGRPALGYLNCNDNYRYSICYKESFNFVGEHRCPRHYGYYQSGEKQCELFWWVQKEEGEKCNNGWIEDYRGCLRDFEPLRDQYVEYYDEYCNRELGYYLSPGGQCTLYSHGQIEAALGKYREVVPSTKEWSPSTRKCQDGWIKDYRGCFKEAFTFKCGRHKCDSWSGYYHSSHDNCSLYMYAPRVEGCHDGWRKYDGRCYKKSFNITVVGSWVLAGGCGEHYIGEHHPQNGWTFHEKYCGDPTWSEKHPQLYIQCTFAPYNPSPGQDHDEAVDNDEPVDNVVP